ncbi:MAG: glycosyltransferase [Deltaproteobacteria bacterium]|nr:MAG: glycosyltransferase [Deltaproteobacteria bacterium]
MAKKVLFVFHNATRTGAPILLFSFLKWFRANAGIPFLILVVEGGALQPDLAELASVWVWKRQLYGKRGLVGSAVHRFGLAGLSERMRHSVVAKRLADENIGLIYSNTAANGEVLDALAGLRCPVICHVHELEFSIRHYRSGLENFRKVVQHTHHYIAASQAVKDNLVRNHGISEKAVDVIHGFLPHQSHLAANEKSAERRLREQLNIPEKAFIVGASGSTLWQKGPDLFVQLAHRLSQRPGKYPVHFLWVGGKTQGREVGSLLHDVKNLGLGERIHFIGAKSNPLDYFGLFDVFALVSREDSFPLVMLECASLGKPIVCFAGSGGATEFVDDGCGSVVPYLDIEAMAERIWRLLESTSLRKTLGEEAAQKVHERHDILVTAPKIVKIMERFL